MNFARLATQARDSAFKYLHTNWIIFTAPHIGCKIQYYIVQEAFFRSVPLELKITSTYGIGVVGEETQLTFRLQEVLGFTQLEGWSVSVMSIAGDVLVGVVSAVLLDESMGVASVAIIQKETTLSYFKR